MDYTDDEEADAKRDVIALVLADIDGDTAGMDAIIGGATERELRGVLRTLLGTFTDVAIKLTVAWGLLENEHSQDVALSADRDTLADNPGLREAVRQVMRAAQASIIEGG